MTDITLPRAELEQVLEAMENFGTDWDGWHRAYMALRERLAQPEQEPVAFVKENPFCPEGHSDELSVYLPVGTKLYTTPPQRQPLTDEEIEACRQQGFAHSGFSASFDFVKAARAIEAAHGIKGEA